MKAIGDIRAVLADKNIGAGALSRTTPYFYPKKLRNAFGLGLYGGYASVQATCGTCD